MKMVYAIGDIHGMINKLERLYDKILLDIKFFGVDDATIIFLGDYMDRGPDGKGVLDFVMGLKDTDELKHIALKGNHETMFTIPYFDAENVHYRTMFLEQGGMETLESFGYGSWFPTVFTAPELRPYMDWMHSLPVKHKIEEYVFVHGGYDTRFSYEAQIEPVLLWKRTPKTAMTYFDCDHIIVHGHTPDINPISYPREIGVDTGAHWSNDTKLTAVALTIPRIHDTVDSRRFIQTT